MENKTVCIDTKIYATSTSATERTYSVPLKLAAQNYEYVAGKQYSVTVSVDVEHVTYSLDASICGEGHRPDLSLDTYTWSCVVDDGDVIPASLESDGKTLSFVSPVSGTLNGYMLDGGYTVTISGKNDFNRIVPGSCCIQLLAE